MTEIPSHLGEAGRSLYVAAVEDYDLSLPELAALLQAAETLDTLRALEDSVRKNGPILASGRVNPLLVELRQQRATLVRLLGILDLRLEDEEVPGENGVRPSVSRQARKAARKRWSK